MCAPHYIPTNHKKNGMYYYIMENYNIKNIYKYLIR